MEKTTGPMIKRTFSNVNKSIIAFEAANIKNES